MTGASVTVGSVLAGYRIERKLGEGGMGAVYLAADPDLPRHDAVKVLSAELSRNPEFRARFIREADLAARLNHPNVVAVYRRGETSSGQLWIAMQYVDGPDADAALKAGTMTPQRAVDIIADIAAALDYAHGNHVVHRDVKPANFLLRPDSPEEHALLADFGIARALDEAGLTASGTVMSTVAYAAPEVLASAPVDYRADVYSLGCSLFKLLTGKTPFWTAGGAPAVMLAHLQQPPPRVTDLMRGLPPALDEVVAVAMAKDPAQRFGSAGELASAATVALHGRSPTVRWRTGLSAATRPTAPFPPAATPDLGRRTRRRPLIVALSATALLAVTAVTALTLSRPHSDAGPPAPTTARMTPVPLQNLPEFMPDAAELSAMLGAPVSIDPPTTGIGMDSESLDDQECAGPWMAGQRAAYFGSGWQALQLQIAKQTGPPVSGGWLARSVVALLSYPVPELASRYLDSQRPVWQKCAGQNVTFTGPDTIPMYLHFGAFTVAADNIFSIGYQRPASSFACGRGLTVRNNISIDVAVCNSGNPVDDAVQLAQRLAAKVTH